MDASVAFLRTIGHPLRWSLLEALAESDQTVHELTAFVKEPQNLVSYHLGKLRHADLVSNRRSSADGRDSYYSVDLGRLEVGLHDTSVRLCGGSARSEPHRTRRGTARVLFLCTGNSARSQMAEALVRYRSDGSVQAVSAGSSPKSLHPLAVQVMSGEYGIDIAAHRTKHLEEFSRRRFDRVITLCDRVREICPEFGNAPRAHWSVADPAIGKATYASFKATAAALDRRITYLLRKETR